jgi:hypothetical protein
MLMLTGSCLSMADRSDTAWGLRLSGGAAETSARQEQHSSATRAAPQMGCAEGARRYRYAPPPAARRWQL